MTVCIDIGIGAIPDKSGYQRFRKGYRCHWVRQQTRATGRGSEECGRLKCRFPRRTKGPLQTGRCVSQRMVVHGTRWIRIQAGGGGPVPIWVLNYKTDDIEGLKLNAETAAGIAQNMGLLRMIA
jgi:hypothetical protein